MTSNELIRNFKIIKNDSFNNHCPSNEVTRAMTIENFKEITEAFENRIKMREMLDLVGTFGCPLHTKKAFLTWLIYTVYSSDQIKDYFFDMIIKETNCLPRQKPNAAGLYKEITGLGNVKFSAAPPQAVEVYQNFKESYDIFKKERYYPDFLVDQTIDLINKEMPLRPIYTVFKNTIQKENKVYYKFLAFVINRIGVKRFETYFQTLIKEFVTKKGIGFGEATIPLLLEYVLGIFEPLNGYHSCGALIGTERVQLKDIILRNTYPYTFMSYQKIDARQNLYKRLGYTDKQIAEYENYIYKNRDRPRQLAKTDLLQIQVEEIQSQLINGTKWQDILDAIDEYFNLLAKHQSRKIPNRKEVREAVIKERPVSFCRDYKRLEVSSSLNKELYNHIDQKSEELREYFYKTNDIEIGEKNWSFTLFYRDRDRYRSYLISLDEIRDVNFRRYFKEYLQAVIKNRPSALYGVLKAHRWQISFLNYVSRHNLELLLLSSEDLLKWLRSVEIEYDLKPATLGKVCTKTRSFLEFLKEKEIIHINPWDGIVLRNIEEKSSPVQAIPEDIQIFLDNHIDEIPQEKYRLIYKILSYTGWRFSEVVALEANQFLEPSEGEDGFVEIFTRTSKTKAVRIKNGLDTVLRDWIPEELFREITAFARSEQPIMDKYNTNKLFFKANGSVLHAISSHTFNLSINRLLKSHGLKSIDARYQRFYSRQTRKTVASTLISNDAPLAVVQKKLGHASPLTTAKSYAEINRKKLGDKNNQFIAKKFGVLLDDTLLSYYTPEERVILYADIKSRKRTVELGICVKHPSQGNCSDMGQTSCAGCPCLCTGKAYLSQWEKLRDDTQNYVDDLRNKYLEHGIGEEQYSDYIEYRQEEELLKLYQDAINHIEKGDKK